MLRAAGVAALLCACTAQPHAWAGRVTSRTQLIGGPRALGDLGDVRISNGRVRFIVQDIAKPSRAFGAFGGSLLDADLVRGAETADPRTQLDGRDGLGEIFPAFFLQGIEPTRLEILDDGSTGGTARVRVTGNPAEFYTATAVADQALLGQGLSFALDYSLGPQDDFLVMTETLFNAQPSTHDFPTQVAPVPLGFITLFGEGQPIFMPGDAGYDARFTLEAAYRRNLRLPAMPGLTPTLVAVEGHGVSYGLSFCASCVSPFASAEAASSTFVFNHRDIYGDAVEPSSLLVPMVSGSLFAVYAGEPPAHLAGGRGFSVSVKLRVTGEGVSHQTDAAFAESGDDASAVSGVLREERSEAPVAANLVILRADGAVVTSVLTDDTGNFRAALPPGDYQAIARRDGHPLSAPLAFSVAPRSTTQIAPHLPRAAYLAAEVLDDQGRLVPAKITLDAPFTKQPGKNPREYLYKLRLGDRYRPTDLDPDPASGRYIEETFRAPTGQLTAEVIPGRYRVTVSRGPAYTLDVREVELTAGLATNLVAHLTRVLPADGRIAADLHVHAEGSVDSGVPLDVRVASYAAEGIDFLALTEHNFISDAKPALQAQGLVDFLQATSGIEESSLEAGHWNAYPLVRDPGSATHGAPSWFRRLPGELFASFRALGTADTIVQVNHPRDPAQGYFSAYGMTGDAFTGEVPHDWPGKSGLLSPNGPGFGPGAFSLDFDAVELMTGKRFDLLRTYRVPSPPPPAPHPTPCDQTTPPDKPGCMGAAGTVVRDTNGNVAFPGVVEDFEHLLDAGRRFTAVANSDSHGVLDEAGYPRNLIDLGHAVQSARQIDENEVARAIKAGRVVATTGPDIRVTAGAQGLGDLIQPDASGYVHLHVKVLAPTWMDVSRGTILVSRGPCNEALADCHAQPLALAGQDVVRFDGDVSVSFPQGRDGWIAISVEGDKSLWPVVTPLEVPPLLINDAVDKLASTFGLSDPYGNLKPGIITQARAWALTNPVFVDGNGDGKWSGGALQAPAQRAARTPEDIFASWK